MSDKITCGQCGKVFEFSKEDAEYLEKIFEGFPVLMVNSLDEVTEELLSENDHLYQQALNLDMNKLDIENLYNKIIQEVEGSL